MMPPVLPAVSTVQHVSTTRQLWGKQNLYVTSPSPYFFNEYRLPLHNGEPYADGNGRKRAGSHCGRWSRCSGWEL